MVSYRPTSQDQGYRAVPPGYPGPRRRRSHLVLALLPVLAIFIGFGSIVWLAYLEGAPASALGDPPLIKADTRPIKLPPDDPGGRQVAERGAVGELLGEAEPGQTERLLPLPEEPLEPPSPEDLVAAATRLEAAVDDTTDDPPGEQDPLAEPPPGDDSAAPAENGGEDDPLRSTIFTQQGPPEETEAAIRELFRGAPSSGARPEVLRPEPRRPGPVAASRASGQPPTRLATPEARTEPPAQPEPQLADDTGDQEQTAAAAPENAPPADVAAARPPDERTVTPAIAPAGRPPQPADAALLEGPHYRVQLAAVRNEADAQRAWDLFLVDYGEVLAGIEPIFERGETTNGVFYRVQLGPYANLSRAEAMCEELKQRNASCFVLRR